MEYCELSYYEHRIPILLLIVKLAYTGVIF